MADRLTCSRCGHRDTSGGDVREPRLVAGLVLAAACRDRDACLLRRLTPSQSYAEAHRAVVAARRARLS